MQNPINILIADDHPIVRQGLDTLIGAQTDMNIIAQASDGAQAVEKASETKPDVIIMDLKMPVVDGVSAIEDIKHRQLEARILVLTSFPDDDMVISAIKAGADGLLLKDTPPQQLLEAIRSVYRGESALHPSIIRRMMQEVREPGSEDKPGDKLTERELDVLRCLSQGKSNQEIALELVISVRTVTTHVRNILLKLGLENRTQAALYAVEHGLAGVK